MVSFDREAVFSQLALLRGEAAALQSEARGDYSVVKSKTNTFAGLGDALLLLRKCVDSYVELALLDAAKIEKSVEALEASRQGKENV